MIPAAMIPAAILLADSRTFDHAVATMLLSPSGMTDE